MHCVERELSERMEEKRACEENESKEMDFSTRYNNLQIEIKNLRSRIKEIISDNNSGKKYGDLLSSNSRRIDKQVNASFRVRRKLEGHFGKIYALHWSYIDCIDIVSASQDGKLLIWNTETTNKKLAINLKSSWVMTCCYSYNNKYIACGGLDSTCSIYDVSNINNGWHSEKPQCELMQHEGYLSCCKFIGKQESNKILTSSGDGTCILWDIEKEKSISIYLSLNKDRIGDIECLDINQEKSIFVCGSIDSIAKVYDYRINGDSSSKSIATFKGHDGDINCIKFFPDGNSFASGSDDNKIKLFDLKSFKLINTYYNKSTINKSSIISLDFTKSGYYLISGHDQYEPFCVAWNTITAQIEKEIHHNSKVSAIQTSPNGYAIATGCWDKLLRIWA